jgi:hypothetical protein
MKDSTIALVVVSATAAVAAAGGTHTYETAQGTAPLLPTSVLQILLEY